MTRIRFFLRWWAWMLSAPVIGPDCLTDVEWQAKTDDWEARAPK